MMDDKVAPISRERWAVAAVLRGVDIAALVGHLTFLVPDWWLRQKDGVALVCPAVHTLGGKHSLVTPCAHPLANGLSKDSQPFGKFNEVRHSHHLANSRAYTPIAHIPHIGTYPTIVQTVQFFRSKLATPHTATCGISQKSKKA